MPTHATRKLDIHSELLPASSAIVIGAGVISLAMGAAMSGSVCLIAGISLGIAGALNKTPVQPRKKVF